MRFEKRRAIITGGSRGIGAALAEQLRAEGAEVCLWARSWSQLPKNGCLSQSVDVSQQREVQHGFAELKEKWSEADLLINNAGAIVVRDFLEMSIEDWRLQLDVNLSGSFYCAQEFARWAKESGHSKKRSIVNVSSLAGLQGLEKFPGFSAYSAAKAGVIALTECLAVELAGLGISSFAVAPGATDTQMLREALPDFKTNTSAESVALRILDLLANAERENKTGLIWSFENA